MKKVVIAAVMAMIVTGAQAKVFDYQHIPAERLLKYGDSFSVECKNSAGIIDKETVDVDAATLTVEIPGRDPVVHPLNPNGGVAERSGEDRFGDPVVEYYVIIALWTQNTGLSQDAYGRWVSRHDGDYWKCSY